MDLCIFDLDGTLIDSQLDLAHSVNATRAFMGMEPLEHSRVYSYIGNGAPVLIRRALGSEASEAEVERALAYFLQYYREHVLDNTVLYAGVREALDHLRSRGVTMAVLTNKPVRISEEILRRLGLKEHFLRIYGGNSFEQKKPHAIGIQTLLSETSARLDATVMVGDSAVDVRTARNAGVIACGVTYGFQPETFAEEPPDLLVDRLDKWAETL
jgi:phosphoglycolate phosphatase